MNLVYFAEIMKGDKRKEILPKLAYWLVTIAAGIALLFFVQSFGNQLLFGDKVTFWLPFFEKLSFWEGFSAQNGTHSFGLIYILSNISIYLFNWQVKADLFVNAGMLIGMAIISFFILKKYAANKLILSDAIFPLLILSLAPYGSLLLNPHVHIMLPFFSLLFALLLTNPSLKWRLILGLPLIFLASFSAFAFVSVAIYLLVLMLQKVHEKGSKFLDNELLINLSFSAFSILLFFLSATQNNAASDLQFTWQNIAVLKDLALNAFGLAQVNYANYWGLAFLVVLTFLFPSMRRNWQAASVKQKSIFLQFSISAVVFAVLVSLGRSEVYNHSGLATRYYSTLCLIPLSLYLIGRSEKFKIQLLWIALGVGIYFLPLQKSIKNAQNLYEGNQKVEACFESAESEKQIEACIDIAKPMLYPPYIKAKSVKFIWFLKENKKASFSGE